MQIKIIAIGKLKSKPISDLVDDYSKRIKRYFPSEVIVAKSEEAIKLDRDDFLVVCDEHGSEVGSVELSGMIRRHLETGTKKLTFFIGDAKGVGPVMKARAKHFLSLSKMTFPHELARVILLEQLYRACTILRGEKYHYG